MSGSGGGGGYQYQAQAAAYIATHILAKRSLHWFDCVSDIPTAVAEETDGPGDDIRITLQDSSVIELQAKHGLKKDKKFWEAIVKLIRGLVKDLSLYGVLLTDSTASSTIRDDLREDIIRLGQGREDNLKTITKEVINRLNREGIPYDSEILKRIRIVVVDLDDSIRNAKVALEVLSNVLQNPEQAEQAWSVLCDDGLDLITKRGQRNAESLLRLLGKKNIQLAPATNLKQPIKWQQICQLMLPIELDANPLISGDGVTLGIEDIVPLDLVERKECPKPTRDPSPENLRQALEDQEIPLSYNRFFEQVLTACRSRNEQGKGIAIIGDPGAGKTTLLCATAHWIMQRNELPIFVSLQDLETDLETYLLETWLRKAISKRKAPDQLQDDLVEQCNAGRVWLLLDGVDEIAEPNRSLSTLAKEFKGWVDNARIVLTCRINVWEANRNALRSKFEVYRSRGFRDEEQYIFIQNFFVKANQVETGIKLVEKLEQAPPRLKDLITNPLLLTLLCRTWKRQQGRLPTTKAELYEGFIRTFYDWKDKSSISEEKRPIMERALGELAKKAINQEDFRFRLRETFIRQELDKFDPTFFDIACELGWINKLGSAVENPDEPVYAFLHPTFQEYFAALAVDDWQYFINHNNDYPNPTTPYKGKACVYRVFSPFWKEVLFTWIESTQTKEECKYEITKLLMNFADGCNQIFYDVQVSCLINELIKHFSYKEEFRKKQKFQQTSQDGSIVIYPGFSIYTLESINSLHQYLGLNNQEIKDLLLFISTADKLQLKDIPELINQLDTDSEALNRKLAIQKLARGIAFDLRSVRELLEEIRKTKSVGIYLTVAWSLCSALYSRRISIGEKDERFDFTNDSVEVLSDIVLLFTHIVRKIILEREEILEILEEDFNWMFIQTFSLCSISLCLVTGDCQISEISKIVVGQLKDCLLTFDSNSNFYTDLFNIILNCSNLSYVDFYQAWHNTSKSSGRSLGRKS